MPNQKFTTVRVYDKDKDALINIHGGPAHEAFHKVIANTCTHPEEQRQYVIADLPQPGNDTLEMNDERRRVGGFFCGACRLYIFREAINPLPAKA